MTLLRGAESIRMIYHARAWTFFCIFFCFLGEGFRWSEKYVVGFCGTILQKKSEKVVIGPKTAEAEKETTLCRP